MTTAATLPRDAEDDFWLPPGVEPVWFPHAGSQTLFLQCPIFEVLYEGTRGPGKTDALLMSFAGQCGRGYGEHWRGILFRQTYKQLADVLAKSRRWFPRIFGVDGCSFNVQDFRWEWATGEVLYFRYGAGEADYWNYHGHEYPWMGFEELTNWKDDSFYESMKACARSSAPFKLMPRMLRSTANPYGIGHNWVKQYFIDPAPRGTVIRQKGKLPRVAIFGHILENWHLLQNDPQYLRTLLSISDPAKRKAWLSGDWDVTSGGMFDDIWKKDVHRLEPFPIPASWRIRRCFDWGSSKPYALLFIAESDGTPARCRNPKTGLMEDRYFAPGSKFVIHELYGWGGKPNVGTMRLSKDIAQDCIDTEKNMWAQGRVKSGPADAAIFATEDGVRIYDGFRTKGVFFVPSEKGPGSRKNGWERVRVYLDNAVKNPRELPGLYVFETCRHTIRTFPSLPRSEKDPDDVDTAAEDHCGDTIRYEIMTPYRSASEGGMY